jgi:hypothetical protein
MQALRDWYVGMTKGQRIFVYIVSTAMVPVYLIGLIPLSVLVYLELGSRGQST